MRIHIKRLFHGFATVRDYQVADCIRKHEPMIIEHDGESMVIPWNTMDKGYINDDVFKSKHSDKTYRLVDFDWKPTQIQISLL